MCFIVMFLLCKHVRLFFNKLMMKLMMNVNRQTTDDRKTDDRRAIRRLRSPKKEDF